MPKAPRTALIAEGAVSQSWVGRLPGLRDYLGPVKGLTLRNASRTVNQIKAGVASDNYKDLQKCELILIGVPDEKLPDWIDDLLGCGLNWARVGFVLCSRRLDSQALARLRSLGGHTGSLSEMEGTSGQGYLYEGDNVALHRLRRLIEQNYTARIFEMKERMRPVYDAGLTFAAGMTFPMIAAAVETMRAAGLPAKVAESAVQTSVTGAVNAYLRAGRRGWAGPVARTDRDELRRQYQALFDVDSDLAEMFLKIAVDYLAEHAAKPGKKSRTKA